MFVLVLLMLIIIVSIAFGYYVIVMKNKSFDEDKKIEDLKRRIEELDVDNIETNSGIAKIIVPDSVDSNESTGVSNQKEECKEYIVNPKQEIKKL